jgi:hypothetical protein
MIPSLPIDNYYGMKVITSIHAVKREVDLSRFRFLSFHKSKLKRNRPPITYTPQAYKMGDTIVAHPSIVSKLDAYIREPSE